MAEVAVRYAFPDPALFDLVAIYIETTVTGDDAAIDIMPPDMASLRIGLSGEWGSGSSFESLAAEPHMAMLSGPTSRSRWLSGKGGTGFAVGLQPLAWPCLFGIKASQLADQNAPLGSLWGDEAGILVERLTACPDFEVRTQAMNAFLIARRGQADAALMTQIAAIRLALADPDCASVEDLAARVGMTQSRLLRLTMATFGFTPKLLIRKERFRRMLHRADFLSYGNWREFIEGQYVDQSHLIRDFQRFLGLAPSQYMALDRPIVAAAFAEARRLLGAPQADG